MRIDKLLALSIIPILAIILTIFTSSANACSCMPAHPQNHYCNADYVIIARVLRKSRRSVKGKDVYKLDIRKTYKMSDKANHYLKHGQILTPKTDAMCGGLRLQPQKLYVIAARSQVLTICDYIKPYQDMTIVERRGFAGAYRKGCNCEVNICFGPNCDKQPLGNVCDWSPFWDCETNFSACVPSRSYASAYSTDKPAKCMWRRNPYYKACKNTNPLDP